MNGAEELVRLVHFETAAGLRTGCDLLAAEHETTRNVAAVTCWACRRSTFFRIHWERHR